MTSDPGPSLRLVEVFRSRRLADCDSQTLILSAVPTVFTPFMDPDFVAFIGSVPSGSVDRDVHDEVIARGFPEVAHVPYALFGRPEMPASLARSIHRDLARSLVRDSDGSLVHRARLLRATLRGAATGDPALVLGRRPSLVIGLIQLEQVAREGVTLPP